VNPRNKELLRFVASLEARRRPEQVLNEFGVVELVAHLGMRLRRSAVVRLRSRIAQLKGWVRLASPEMNPVKYGKFYSIK